MKRPHVRDFHKDADVHGMSLTFRPTRKTYMFTEGESADVFGKTELHLAGANNPTPTISSNKYDERAVGRVAKSIANTKE